MASTEVIFMSLIREAGSLIVDSPKADRSSQIVQRGSHERATFSRRSGTRLPHRSPARMRLTGKICIPMAAEAEEKGRIAGSHVGEGSGYASDAGGMRDLHSGCVCGTYDRR